MINEKNNVVHHLNDQVNKYEKTDTTYNYEELDSNILEGMIKELVAFKISIIKIEAQVKLSQNHTKERQELIIKYLENNYDQNDREVAALIRSNLINKKVEFYRDFKS